MKQRRWKQLAAAVLALSLTACGTVPAEQPGRTVKLASEEQVTCIDVPPLDEAGAAKLTDFGLRLAWHSMANGRSALVSPMSVATALAMTANGAEGATLAELEDVLGLDKDALNGALCAWWASLPESNEAAVRSANSIWFTDHDRFTVDQEFLKTCTATYGAELFQTPMDAGTSRDINRWVKEKTEGMVPKIVDEVPESAVMYLVNALAFEGTWAEPYRKQQVQEGVFLTDSVPVQTTFLYSQETQYLENELATGVMKPYAGGEYAFAALLPKGDLTLMALLDRLDGETLQALLRAPQKAAVQTAIPKFETRDSGRLREALTDMGLSRAFTEQAELGGVGTSTADRKSVV